MNHTPARPLEEPVYYPGAVDYAAVEEFLSLLNPKAETDRVAQLVAKMTFKEEGASPSDLVQSALGIQVEAEKSVICRRESILAKMNLSTVLRLLAEVEKWDSATSEGEDRDQGPYRSTRLAVMERLEQAKVPPSVGKTRDELFVALALADMRGVPRPAAPCDLATGLRYAIGAKRMHPGILDKAFEDFLYIFQLQRMTNIEAIEERELRRELDGLDVSRVPQKIGEVVKAVSTEWDKEIFTNPRERLSWLEDRRSFLLNFKPGLKPPGSIERETIELIEVVWKQSDSVSVESLVWLSANFYPFWTKHMRSYLKNHKTARLAEEKTKIIKTVAGSIGVEKREHEKLVKFVIAWLEYADSLGKRPCDVIDVFVNQSDLKSSEAQKTRIGFLSILHAHATQNTSVAGVVKQLRQRMKSMTPGILGACANVCNQHSMRASASLRPAGSPAPTSPSSKSKSKSKSKSNSKSKSKSHANTGRASSSNPKSTRL